MITRKEFTEQVERLIVARTDGYNAQSVRDQQCRSRVKKITIVREKNLAEQKV